MKSEIRIEDCPLGTAIVHLHSNGPLNGTIVERDTPNHRVVIQTDLGEYYAPIGNVQVLRPSA